VKFSVSNIGLTAYEHGEEIQKLGTMGLSGLEVAPSRVWHDTWKGLSGQDVANYRKQIERAGLKVVGLHSLFFDHPDFGLFKSPGIRKQTLEYMAHLSRVCRDLGGKTLIYGGGRHRGDLPLTKANTEALQFFSDLIPLIEDHGTCFCFEPLGPKTTNFINTARESIYLVEQLKSPCLKVQLDAKALVENNEANLKTFQFSKPYLVHFHANEPGLGVLGDSGAVDHKVLGAMLRDIGYDDYVSIEQRMLNELTPLEDIRRSAEVLIESYG
jgi:sugar phosphate isomerase/epimerase